MSIALYGYLQDKFGIQNSEFTIERAIQKLYENNIPENFIEQIKNISEKCEFVRFAPSGLNSVSAKEIYENTIKVIVDIDSILEKKK